MNVKKIILMLSIITLLAVACADDVGENEQIPSGPPEDLHTVPEPSGESNIAPEPKETVTIPKQSTEPWEEDGYVWQPAYGITEDMLIRFEGITEAETQNYTIGKKSYSPTEAKENMYYFSSHSYGAPKTEVKALQIKMKEDVKTLYNEKLVNACIIRKAGWVYCDSDIESCDLSCEILYADDFYMFFLQTGVIREKDRETKEVFDERPYKDVLAVNMERLDRSGLFYLENQIEEYIDMDGIYRKIMTGNCFIDSNAFKAYEESPAGFTELLAKDEDGKWHSDSLYVRDGRVGFLIPTGMVEEGYVAVEVAYDWKSDLPQYKRGFKLYAEKYRGKGLEDMEFYYPKMEGGYSEGINKVLKKAFAQNILEHLDELQRLGIEMRSPVVVYENDRFICFKRNFSTTIDWMNQNYEPFRYFLTFDIQNSTWVKLDDLISVDDDFFEWLTEGNFKIDAYSTMGEEEDRKWLLEVMDEEYPDERLRYPKERLLYALRESEFMLSRNRIEINVPFWQEWSHSYKDNMFNSPVFTLYIDLDDIEEFLKVEKW